ncbi:hypothetical protein U1Q18_046143 [Sarracenia purpurea var. burkii]
MPVSRSSANLMRKWSSTCVPDHRSDMSEELERRVGIMETSLNRFGMILDSIQSDIMQVNKGTKEVLMESNSLQLEDSLPKPSNAHRSFGKGYKLSFYSTANATSEEEREWRIPVESDEEIDVGFSCLLAGKEIGNQF